MSNFIKKLFYKRKGSTKKYKLFGLTLVKISKKPTKKIIKILGIKFTKKIKPKAKKQKLIFAPELKNCTKLFDNNKSFKRLAVFASFNKDGLILDYVVYYLKELKKVVDGIIFVTDNPILPTELEKIKDFIVYAECQRHEEYDFGSYKRGFFWAKKNGLLKDCEELVFCNDSCYGPVYPFSEMFEEMSTRSCDFWGMTQNIEIAEHIQSYFLVFQKNVFNSRHFIKFIKNIKPQSSVQKVIKKYEIGLSQHLLKHGFIADSYVEYNPTNDYPYIYHKNLTIFPIFLLEKKAPLIKVKAINKYGCNIDGINNLIEYIKNKNKHVYELLKEYYVDIDNNTKFSLIMPTYNRKELISKSINSVLNQTYQNFELIIIDDGSTDGTEEFIKNSYPKELQSGKIKYIYKDNEGVCKARNIGLQNAQYDWIGYVDSDNMVYPNYLEVFADGIQHNEHKVYYSQFRKISNFNITGHYFIFEKLIEANYIDLGTIIHHRQIYKELGGFDENMTRLVDWDLILTYTKKYSPYYIALPTLLYNDLDNHARISNNSNYEKNLEYIRKKHCSFTVSTVITTYNHEKYIAQAIESAIKQQGYFHHEILISDDGSTDNTREIIKEYAKKYPNLIKDISSEKNLGISENMKKCFQQASGKYIAVLEGDDYWEDEYKLHKQAYFLESNQDCSMVFNKIKVLQEDTKKIILLNRQQKLSSKLKGSDFIESKYLNLIANFSSCLFISKYMKKLPKKIYSIRFNEITLAFYLEQKGYIGFINSPLSVYRQHNHGVWTGASENDQKAQAKKILQTCLSVCSPKYKKDIQEIIDKKYNN
ncbi:MAG: glycosyltransferase [Alphaproteobacteria bacterium]|nr:glycosyltransferase [Alphaproteobacteria bacterium]